MKKLLLVLASLLPLFSCIPVEDFGAYWSKAGIDKRLAGNWRRVAANADQTREHGYPIGDILHVVEKEGSYDMSLDDKTAGERRLYPVRTLEVGSYHYWALGQENQKGGIIERYKVNAGVLEFCDSIGPSLVEFVGANYPHVVNMRKNRGEGDYMTIGVFDDDVFTILSKIPDTQAYWVCDTKFERIP